MAQIRKSNLSVFEKSPFGSEIACDTDPPQIGERLVGYDDALAGVHYAVTRHVAVGNQNLWVSQLSNKKIHRSIVRFGSSIHACTADASPDSGDRVRHVVQACRGSRNQSHSRYACHRERGRTQPYRSHQKQQLSSYAEGAQLIPRRSIECEADEEYRDNPPSDHGHFFRVDLGFDGSQDTTGLSFPDHEVWWRSRVKEKQVLAVL